MHEVPSSQVSQFGIVGLGPRFSDALPVTTLVEKPSLRDAPSRFGAIGRYILTADIFESLEETLSSYYGPVHLTDALRRLLDHQSVYAHIVQSPFYDCGTKQGYVQAIVQVALQSSELRGRLQQQFRALVDHEVDA